MLGVPATALLTWFGAPVVDGGPFPPSRRGFTMIAGVPGTLVAAADASLAQSLFQMKQ